MLPAVFPLLTASTAVKAIIGTNPTRAYRHGYAPQRVQAPYVTWSSSGRPENELDDIPGIDEYTVNLDCWSDDDDEVEALATAVRDAIEPTHHLITIGTSSRDQDTKRYRFSLTFTFWTHR